MSLFLKINKGTKYFLKVYKCFTFKFKGNLEFQKSFELKGKYLFQKELFKAKGSANYFNPKEGSFIKSMS